MGMKGKSNRRRPTTNQTNQTNRIKGLPAPSSKSKYTQGIYPHENTKKFFGQLPIVFRSSLELAFINRLEQDDNVAGWSSEHIIIPYIINKEVHKYHTDFTVILKDKRKYLIEIKPLSFVPLNESAIRRSPEMYKNACKWKAALEWAKQNGYIFKVVTEDGVKAQTLFI
jgi:hypothetical protein